MTVTEVTLIGENLAGTFTDDGTEATLTYRVKTNDPNDSILTIRSASGLPRRGDAFSFGNDSDPQLQVYSVRPRRPSISSLAWFADIAYRRNNDSFGEPSMTQSWIQNQRPRIRFHHEFFRKPAVRTLFVGDTGGSFGLGPAAKPGDSPASSDFVTPHNSASDVFDPYHMIDGSHFVMEIERNEDIKGVFLNLAFAYQDAVNSDSWFGGSRRQWKFVGIGHEVKEVELRDFDFYQYIRANYIFQFRRETWDAVLLDNGPYHLATANDLDTKTPFEDLPKNRIFGNLDRDGTDLSIATDAAVNYKVFQVYQELPFSAFNLPEQLTAYGGS